MAQLGNKGRFFVLQSMQSAMQLMKRAIVPCKGGLVEGKECKINCECEVSKVRSKVRYQR